MSEAAKMNSPNKYLAVDDEFRDIMDIRSDDEEGAE